MKDNLFIVLEGIDGSGKSTQTKILSDKLEALGHKTYITFEPTDNFIGSIIRDILQKKRKADQNTIAALFVADRLHHLQNNSNGILKMLDEGFIVISDRYYFSSYAYHGIHIPMEWVIEANSLAARLLRPDLNIFIDIAPEISMKRLQNNRVSADIFENSETQIKVRAKYFEAFEKLKNEENICVIDGNRNVNDIAEDILFQTLSLLNDKK